MFQFMLNWGMLGSNNLGPMMLNIIIKPYGKRALILLALLVCLAAIFWTQSRYPALDEKAMMSGAIQLEDPLSFEAKYPTTPDMPVLKRMWLTTLNWLYTNKQGMAFGILLGSVFLTFFGYLRQRSFKNGHLNALLGLFIGAPLGVCVNCAAPIAKGMYASGMRAETTLAAMIASPTMNVVVLTMLISLFPTYMVVAKIALSLAVVLLVVPLVCKLLPRSQLEVVPTIAASSWDIEEPSEAWGIALLAVIRQLLSNLWFIIKTTVPLMILAGALGAIVATLLPGALLSSVPFSVGVVCLVVVIGVFLPVPIAFDVVVAAALLSGGLAPGYVMALLFTLGIFSVYSFFIVSQAISLRAGMLTATAIAILGIFSGVGAQYYHQWQSDRALQILLGNAAPFGAANAQAAGVKITRTPYAARSAAGEKPFTRSEANTTGIDKPIEFSFQDMWPPFWEGRGLATGDIDRDGDIDLIVASTHSGLYQYRNDGVGRFTKQGTQLGILADLPIFNAVLVDIDNDGWLDLFVATYLSGNFWIRNVDGTFKPDTIQTIANRPNAVLTMSASFGDVNQDGFLDVALGNWAAGWYRRIPGEESRNRVVLNDAGKLDGRLFYDLDGQPGETLSLLFSDINGDGFVDLLAGNDFEIPDEIYLGGDNGRLDQVTFQDGMIPQTTTTTMAIKTGDLHNDGVSELYFAQIAGRSSGVSEILKMQPLEFYCDGIENVDASETCKRNMQIKAWYKSGNNFDPTYAKRCQTLSEPDRSQCKAMLVKDLAIQRNDPKICKLIAKSQPIAKAYCTIHFWPSRAVTQDDMNKSIPQILRSNVLLQRDAAGIFTDVATEQKLGVGGWSWDTKIGDFDNDGWQDVYIVNGTWVPNEVSPSNLFFHNDGEGSFTEQSGPFGLEDYLMTATATQFDMDNDGDLDLLTHPVNGPMTLFTNNNQTGNAITLQLRDFRGNHYAIGAQVKIETIKGMQSREVQLGGGFMSFDALDVHFGLGDLQNVKSVTIRWPDGKIDEFGPLTSGASYRVIRH
jgi:uncharacterized membrane protein YraQ (UPF0718 family)